MIDFSKLVYYHVLCQTKSRENNNWRLTVSHHWHWNSILNLHSLNRFVYENFAFGANCILHAKNISEMKKKQILCMDGVIVWLTASKRINFITCNEIKSVWRTFIEITKMSEKHGMRGMIVKAKKKREEFTEFCGALFVCKSTEYLNS